MIGTFWAFVPAIVAIVLALATKQVYVSLFVGILTGVMFIAEGNPVLALGKLYETMSESVGGNAAILVFLVVLGILVVLMQKSGGAKAYGEWAQTHIKSKSGALAATAGLGCLIFVDDYFNCLTVGSVMRPVTDKFKVSHAKLAYIIDSTAAPVCIIAPISSWAAAVSGQLEEDGLLVFIKTIPYNLYALLTIAMVFVLCYLNLDFGKMKKNETIAATSGDLDAGEVDKSEEDSILVENPNGKVRHLVVPVVILIICCVLSMIYSGYFYNWGSDFGVSFANEDVVGVNADENGVSVLLKDNDAVNTIISDNEIPLYSEDEEQVYYYEKANGYVAFSINNPTLVTAGESLELYTELESAGYGTTTQSGSVIEAFSNCDAGTSLAIGSTIALILIAVYYMLDKVLSFKAITDSFTQGFKAMVPAILILTFAWTLAAVMGAKGGGLDAQAFVQENLENIPEAVRMLFPAIFFVLAGAIAFSTGTSWGTFGVLVPISITILSGTAADPLTILTVSAILGGAVYGDHVSPISDTTILASAGGNCNHVDHVKTQLPYASLIACIAFLSYIVGGLCTGLGFILSAVLMWLTAIALFVGALFGIKYLNKKNAEKSE